MWNGVDDGGMVVKSTLRWPRTGRMLGGSWELDIPRTAPQFLRLDVPVIRRLKEIVSENLKIDSHSSGGTLLGQYSASSLMKVPDAPTELVMRLMDRLILGEEVCVWGGVGQVK